MNQTLAVTKIEAVEEIGPGIFEVRVLLEQASLCQIRIVAKTRQPRDARTTAVACPMPVDVPVIRTDRMRSSKSVSRGDV